MKRYRLKTVASGANAGLWVSLGFTSSLERKDVLHIVSGDQATAAGARSRARLYVERFEQLYSCNGGGELVRVRPTSVEVHLTAKAEHLLSFESGVLLFEFEKRLPGYAEAVRTFRAMTRVSQRVEIQGSPPEPNGRNARRGEAGRRRTRG